MFKIISIDYLVQLKMIKIHPTIRINPQNPTVLLTKQYKSLQNKVQKLAKSPASLQISKYPSNLISLKSSQFEKHKQVFEWRQKTQFPIVAIRSWYILSEKQINQESSLQVLIQLESQLKSLQQIKKLPFFQAIYILKESLIGFERLVYRFGNFDISADMIKFNRTKNCKVWINEECFSNNSTFGSINSQKQFIQQLCQIMWPRTIKSKNSTDFFQKVETCTYFFQAIGTIDTFAKSNRIKVPNSLQNLQQGNSTLRNPLNLGPLNDQNYKKNLVTSSKIPAFIIKNQVKKKYSYQTYSPVMRKITTVTQNCLLDRSFSNISRNLSSISYLKKQPSNSNVQENQKFDQDSFMKNLNIRLVEPNPQNKYQVNFPSTQVTSGCASYRQNAPQSPFSPYAKVSQFDSNDEIASGLSFNKCVSKECQSPFQTAQNMFLTVVKPQKLAGTRSTVPNSFNSGKKSKKPKDMCIDRQSTQNIQSYQYQASNRLSMKIGENRQKRKYSGDLGCMSSRTDEGMSLDSQKKLQIPKYSTTNNLSVPNGQRNKEYFFKSPSHEVITRTPQNESSQEGDKGGREFLRQTVMNRNGWKGFALTNEHSDIKQSLVDGKQIQLYTQSKTNQLLKLGNMGRNIKSSMISQCQFQLQFGQQILKQKQLRNEVMGLFD